MWKYFKPKKNNNALNDPHLKASFVESIYCTFSLYLDDWPKVPAFLDTRPTRSDISPAK